jgi:hypothetical protein
MPSYWLRWGGLTNFLPGLDLNCNPPDVSLPSSLDYRPEPLCLAESTGSLFINSTKIHLILMIAGPLQSLRIQQGSCL